MRSCETPPPPKLFCPVGAKADCWEQEGVKAHTPGHAGNSVAEGGAASLALRFSALPRPDSPEALGSPPQLRSPALPLLAGGPKP